MLETGIERLNRRLDPRDHHLSPIGIHALEKLSETHRRRTVATGSLSRTIERKSWLRDL